MQLTGTIEPEERQGGAWQFRYAPLSNGLEIVRKTLDQHEMATVQTTAIGQAASVRTAEKLKALTKRSAKAFESCRRAPAERQCLT